MSFQKLTCMFINCDTQTNKISELKLARLSLQMLHEKIITTFHKSQKKN